MLKFAVVFVFILNLGIGLMLIGATDNQIFALNSQQISDTPIQLDGTSGAVSYPEVDLAFTASSELSFTPIQTPAPTPIATSTPKPKQSPSSLAKLPLKTPIPTPVPSSSPIPSATPETIAQQVPAGSLSGDKIFDLTNAHRRSKGLSELVKDERSCELARSRAPEIMSEVKAGTMHKGLADRKLPYWNNENIAYYNTEEETVRWWVSDYIHRKQIEGNFKYSCVACYKNACAQELTNFQPK